MKHSTNNARTAIANFIIHNVDKFYPQVMDMIYDPKVAQEKYPEWFEYMKNIDMSRISAIDEIYVGCEPYNFMVVKATLSDICIPGTTVDVKAYPCDDWARLVSIQDTLFDLGMFASTCRYGVPHEWLKDDAPSKLATHWNTICTDDPQLLYLIKEEECGRTRFAGSRVVYIPFTRKPAGKGLLNSMTAIPASVFWHVSMRQRLPMLSDYTVAALLATQIAIHNDPAIVNTLGALDESGKVFYSKTHMEQLAPVWNELFTKENLFEDIAERVNSLSEELNLDVLEFNRFVLSLIHWPEVNA